MWIKTADGDMLNLDRAYAVVYIKPKDITAALTAECPDYVKVADGDYTAVIAEAIYKGRTYLEVH